jgi:hypothetical protein
MRHIRTSLCPGSLFDLTISMSRYSSEQLLKPIRIGGGAGVSMFKPKRRAA